MSCRNDVVARISACPGFLDCIRVICVYVCAFVFAQDCCVTIYCDWGNLSAAHCNASPKHLLSGLRVCVCLFISLHARVKTCILMSTYVRFMWWFLHAWLCLCGLFLASLTGLLVIVESYYAASVLTILRPISRTKFLHNWHVTPYNTHTYTHHSFSFKPAPMCPILALSYNIVSHFCISLTFSLTLRPRLWVWMFW